MSNSFDNFLTNIGDVTVERVSKRDTLGPPERGHSDVKAINPKGMMDGRQAGNDECSEDSDASDTGRRKKITPMRTDDIEEIRTEGSADDMDLDETIDSHIGVRMETERQHIQSLPSDEEEEEEEDDDIGIDSVNILDTLPLEGAPIEGQEVSEADLLGKINDDDDEDEEKSLSRSGEEDNLDVNKRSRNDDDDDEVDTGKKKQKKDDGSEGPSELEAKSDKKNMRRNIREVMDETQLDEATLAAQRQEMERLRRVQEQQRIIREVQRRQNSRGVSLLRSNQSAEGLSEVRLPNTVMLKVNSGSASGGQASVGQQAGLAPRRPMNESSRWQRGGRGFQTSAQTSISRLPAGRGGVGGNSSVLQQRIRMMTPSVSISPVVPKKEPIEHLEYYTDSDLSEAEAEAEEAMLRDKQLQQARKLAAVSKPGLKVPKGKDVVTISSSSESSDDDCIVLSDPSEVEETDNEDDPSNSGMHTNDRYNIPDEQGRVLVNVGHPEDEPDVFLAPQVARIIKPHQIGGIRFLYDNIVESIERFKTSSGFGCILAHSMGLGKTLQIASFCDIFFRCTTSKTVLCIMPINTLQNWLAEFNMWLPYEDPNKPKVEEKPAVKEESNQSDLSYISRSGSEQESSNQGQQQPGMVPDSNNPYAAHHGYNQNMVPHYGPSGGMFDPRYCPSYPSAGGYNPVKTEPMNPYSMDNRNSSQYNPAYPSGMQHPPNYPGMDPSMHHGMNAQTPMYPGYGTTPYPNYGSQPRPADGADGSVKKLENNAESSSDVKPEIKEEPKKEPAAEPKKEEEKKDEATIKTPYSVAAPPELETRPRHFSLHILNDSHKTMAARARVIREWQKVGGVLLIGYELYRQLSLKKPNKAKRKRGQPFRDPSMDVEEEDKNKPLLDEMHIALVNPGPDLVICDEGHRIKNSHASISLALKQMRTKRRVVLTGYPLQNNLLEYWCMVDFVRPNYLGTKSEFCNMFERPIQNGQCIDSTPQDIRLMRYRAHVLHALLEGFVQRRSHSVLQISLPRKEEYILLVRMTPHQRKLYDTFMNQVVKTRAVPNPLKAFAVCCKIWNHPDVLYHFLRKRQANEEDDLDLEETIGDKTPTGGKRTPKARQPKGESKKGKKANLKNKPAASIQPNISNEHLDTHDVAQKPPFQNFNAPVPLQTQPPGMANNSNFQHTTPQNNYQQQQQQQQSQQRSGYQNYRSDERSGDYHGGEYNDFYGAQAQQKYPPTGNQNNFPPYSQNSNYTPGNQTPQQTQYQGQKQAFNTPANDGVAPTTGSHAQRFSGPSSAGPSPSPSPQNFRSDQNQAGVFPRPNYPYQDRDRNYPATMNQNQNYPQMQSQQAAGFHSQNQSSNQMGMSDYNSYPTTNTNQAYGNTTQGSGMNYPNTPQQSPSSNAQQSGYMGTANATSTPTTPTFPQNQQMPNSYQSSTAQQNQSHSYPTTPSPMTPSPAMGFNSSQQQTTQQQHAYPQNVAQSQMRGYQNAPQSSTPGYGQNHVPASVNQQNQQHVYPNDQPNLSQQHQHQSQSSQMPQQHQHQPQQSHIQQQPHSHQQTQQPHQQTQQTHQQTVQSHQQTPQSHQQSQQSHQQPPIQQQQHQQTQMQQTHQQQPHPQQPHAQQPHHQQTHQQPSHQQQILQHSQQPHQQSHSQHHSQVHPQTQPQSQHQPQTVQQPHQVQPHQQSHQTQSHQQIHQAQSHQQSHQAQSHQQSHQAQSHQQSHQQSHPSQQHQTILPQQHGYNQQTPSFSPTSQTQQVSAGQMGFPPNQTGSSTGSSQIPGGYQTNAQQNSSTPLPPNQSLNYSQNPQGRTIKTEPQHGYPRTDTQSSQNHSYPVTPSTPHSFPPASQQMPTANQVPNTQQQQQQSQPVQGQDQFWQRNYNDPYYNEANVNQFSSNYQSNATPSNNYSNQQNQSSQYRDYATSGMTDSKPPQPMSDGPHMQNSTQPTSTGSHMQNATQQTNVSVVLNPSHPPPNNTPTAAAPYGSSVLPTPPVNNPMHNNQETIQDEDKDKEDSEKDKLLDKDKEKEDKSDDELIIAKDDADKDKCSPGSLASAMSNIKDDPGIPYDWATELMKGYVPGLIDASAKMTIFFCILEEAIRLGDRVLAFSQSLFTLNLIEDFLARNNFKNVEGQSEAWAKNVNYYRLDGSTSALEREKLINEFNVNSKVHLFLVSTRAGSLGINLVGANRAIVFDASWNPCHDTQAVCRVYRYGQRKNCYVYRLVTDNCLERKIYDRQISKQGMADRVVDQCNPDAHLSLKEATTLSWDWEEDSQVQDFSDSKDKYTDEVMHIVLEKHSSLLTKQPFHHESLLVDRKDKKLSQAEKRLARRGYELEKMAANCSRPSYNYVPGNTATRGSLQIRQIRGDGGGPAPKPVASVRPMQQRGAEGLNARNPTGSRWIPAEVWQRQGMSAQEMTLPLDVVIPTNSPDKGSIVLKAGQRVMVLKSPKGIYMQLESGKIIAIRTALKINQQKKEEELPKKSLNTTPQRNSNKGDIGFPLRNNSAISIIPKTSTSNTPVQQQQQQQQQNRPIVRTGVNYRPFGEKEVAKRTKPVATATAKPYSSQIISNQVSLSRINKPKHDNPSDVSSMGENSNSSDGQKVRSEQRVEEVRIEDVVAETGSNSDYSPSSRRSNSDTDSSSTLQRPMQADGKVGPTFPLETSPARGVQAMCQTQEQRNCFVPDPKLGAPKKFVGQKDKKPDSCDEVIVEEPPLHQPVPRAQPRSSAPRVTSDVALGVGKNVARPKPTEHEAQGYPYAQYPRYYDYGEPRPRPIADPYGSYYPPGRANPETHPPAKPTVEEVAPKQGAEGTYPRHEPKNEAPEPSATKPAEATPPAHATGTTATATPTAIREEPHVPTAFSHPSSVRSAYPGPYPPAPYDPYAQHYPPAPASSAPYSATAAPGYPAYGGPSYNADYARMYSAFHGPPPPPAGDPYVHRSYAPPPASHPSNYYPPFPHPPPPPYPNYSFLPPYPNPNVPAEPQPPAQ